MTAVVAQTGYAGMRHRVDRCRRWGQGGKPGGGLARLLVGRRESAIPGSSQLFPDLNERIADFGRRMAELQAEIDRLPEGRERRDALDAIAEVARALGALKDRKP